MEGNVGAALSIWEGAAETSTKKLKLPECCSVYQAELLSEATEQVLKNRKRSCNIFCASKSALETVTSVLSPHPLAVKARNNMTQLKGQNKSIGPFWIKALAGMEGNERTDELAKSATLHIKTKPHYDSCPVSFARRQIRMESLGEWNRRYCDAETAATKKLFFPNAVEAYKIVKTVNLHPVIVQILTGHGGFSSYLYRFRCKENPACICDPEKEESVLHLIAGCPNYNI